MKGSVGLATFNEREFMQSDDDCIRVETDGVLGLVPHSWPPGPVRVAAVLPTSSVASKISIGDELLLVARMHFADRHVVLFKYGVVVLYSLCGPRQLQGQRHEGL